MILFSEKRIPKGMCGMEKRKFTVLSAFYTPWDGAFCFTGEVYRNSLSHLRCVNSKLVYTRLGFCCIFLLWVLHIFIENV